jgi:Apea-like HEPN
MKPTRSSVSQVGHNASIASAAKSTLEALGLAIRKKVLLKRRHGLLKTERVRITRRKDRTLRYISDMMLGAIDPEHREVDWWPSEELMQFISDEVATLTEYRDAEASTGFTREGLQTFSGQIAHKAFHKSTAREIRKLVGLFLLDKSDQPRTHFKVYINGMHLKESPLLVTNHLTLRRPETEDLIEEVFSGADMMFSLPVADFLCIADFVSMHWGGVGQEEVLKTVDALSLFRVGAVVTPRYSSRSESFNPDNGIMSPPSIAPSRYSFSLDRSDIKALRRFLAICVPAMPSPFSQVEKNHKEIALARYRDALFSIRSIERTVASAVMSLEALFLDGKDELKHRLSQRVAVLLGTLSKQTDPLAVFSELGKAYNIRSSFAHGKVLKEADRQYANQLAPRLLNYARASVTVFLQITISKNDLLNLIDDAMLSPKKMLDLRRSLKAVICR